MSYTKDPRVDAYIDRLPEWQQKVCQEVRELVHDADPEVVETIKRSVQPYFVLEGNIAALLAAKDHVGPCSSRSTSVVARSAVARPGWPLLGLLRHVG